MLPETCTISLPRRFYAFISSSTFPFDVSVLLEVTFVLFRGDGISPSVSIFLLLAFSLGLAPPPALRRRRVMVTPGSGQYLVGHFEETALCVKCDVWN